MGQTQRGCRADPRPERVGAWPSRGRGPAGLGAGPRAARLLCRCRGRACWRAASRLRDGPRAMAASLGPAGVGGAGPSGFAFDSGLEIKTRSVEQTLLPLVSQVNWLPARPLVSLRQRPAMAAAARTTRGRVGPGGRQPLPHIPHQDCGVGSGCLSEAWGPDSVAAAAFGLDHPKSGREAEWAARQGRQRGGEPSADRRAGQAGAPPGLPRATRLGLRLRRPRAQRGAPRGLPRGRGDPAGAHMFASPVHTPTAGHSGRGIAAGLQVQRALPEAFVPVPCACRLAVRPFTPGHPACPCPLTCRFCLASEECSEALSDS